MKRCDYLTRCAFRRLVRLNGQNLQAAAAYPGERFALLRSLYRSACANDRAGSYSGVQS